MNVTKTMESNGFENQIGCPVMSALDTDSCLAMDNSSYHDVTNARD